MENDLLDQIKAMPYGNHLNIDFYVLHEFFPPVLGPTVAELTRHISIGLSTSDRSRLPELPEQKSSLDLLKEALDEDYEVTVPHDKHRRVRVYKKLSACPMCQG